MATCVDEDGRRYPDSWGYFGCDRCDARLKISIGGKIEDPTEEEWALHCTGRGIA